MWRRTPDKRTVAQSYDDAAAGYDTAYLSAADLAENRWVRKKVAPLVNHGAQHTVVDVGCGTGLLLELLDIDRTEYVGLDISRGMLDRARSKFPGHTFIEHDMEAPWPIPPATADVVVSLWAMNYSFNPETTIRHLADTLRPGGRFLFTVCSTKWPDRHSYAEQHDGHTRKLFHADELRDLFTDRRFRDVRVYGLSRWVDLARHAPVGVARMLLGLEASTILRIAPSQAYFLVVEGVRTNTGPYRIQ